MRRDFFALAIAVGCWFFVSVAFSQEQDYSFDISEVEKKPYHIGGFFEAEPILFGLDPNSALYKLRYFDESDRRLVGQASAGFRLEAGVEKGLFSAFARTESFLRYDERGWDTRLELLEGYVALKPRLGLAAEVGKRVTKWGTGYFHNVVSFVDRPKDPEDPQEPLEGFYVLKFDFIKSFEGPIRTVAFTPVVLPVTEDVNRDFGIPDHVNFAAKLYFLMWNTDVDVIFFTGDSRTTRFGLDFARNIQSNLEVHGEVAWISDVPRFSFDAQGSLAVSESDAVSVLAGLRYLTGNQITFIVEYFHNGAGIREEGFRSFVQRVDEAYEHFAIDGGRELLQQAQSLRATFAGGNPMRDTLYFRASQKEPFDILYFTPGLTSIVNLRDGSFMLTPEVQYSPVPNLALRFRTVFLVGGEATQYGEKFADYRLELRLRYFF